jgi:hypothetical protein
MSWHFDCADVVTPALGSPDAEQVGDLGEIMAGWLIDGFRPTVIMTGEIAAPIEYSGRANVIHRTVVVSI